MIAQKFKGDETELKMYAAAAPAFDVTSLALEGYLAGGYAASPFLLMLYDEGRAPFSDRVPRDSFVDFIKEALRRFPFTGSYDSYVFIIQAVFGAGSDVLFDIPEPGKLEMRVNASSRLQYNLVIVELINGVFTESNLVDRNDNQMIAAGLSGIDSEFELELLLSELIPGGIFPAVALAKFALYQFVAADASSIVDNIGNQIVFLET